MADFSDESATEAFHVFVWVVCPTCSAKRAETFYLIVIGRSDVTASVYARVCFSSEVYCYRPCENIVGARSADFRRVV